MDHDFIVHDWKNTLKALEKLSKILSFFKHCFKKICLFVCKFLPGSSVNNSVILL